MEACKFSKIENANEARTKTCSEATDEETTAEQLVFSNDYLLWKIFKASEFEDLKSFREVNHMWNFEATKLLQKNQRVAPLKIENSNFTLDMSDASKPAPVLTLQQFSRFLSNSLIFPCTGLKLEDCINDVIQNEELLSFLQTHGDLFQNLEIHFVYLSETILLTVETSFAKYFPNLKRISIDPGVGNGSKILPISPCTSIMEMKSLKELTYVQHTFLHKEELGRILRICPNLEKIFWSKMHEFATPFNFLENVVDLNAFSLLKKGHLLLSPESFKIYEKVIEQKPKFEEIDEIGFHNFASPSGLKKAEEILTKLLNSCSQTVTKIHNMNSVGFMNGLKLPAFSKVVHLSICFNQTWIHSGLRSNPLLPPGANFSNLFPNLKKLEFDFSAGQTDLKTIFPAPIIPLLNVKELIISSGHKQRTEYIPNCWLKEFCEMFPNVTKATFPALYDSALKYVWSLDYLEDLNFVLGVNTGADSYPKVDSAFTGFSQKRVKLLYSNLCTSFKMSSINVRALLAKPSIADLKCLKRLRVDLVDKKILDGSIPWSREYEKGVFGADYMQNILVVNGNVVLSHVARKFFYDMCPKQKSFKFTFKGQQLLSMDH